MIAQILEGISNWISIPAMVVLWFFGAVIFAALLRGKPWR